MKSTKNTKRRNEGKKGKKRNNLLCARKKRMTMRGFLFKKYHWNECRLHSCNLVAVSPSLLLLLWRLSQLTVVRAACSALCHHMKTALGGVLARIWARIRDHFTTHAHGAFGVRCYVCVCVWFACALADWRRRWEWNVRKQRKITTNRLFQTRNIRTRHIRFSLIQNRRS